MDGRSISKEMAMQIADRELGPSMRERKLLECLAAADRLAETFRRHDCDGYISRSIGGTCYCRGCAAIADYDAKRKGEEAHDED